MAKELTVKSKFFAMEDKVVVEGSAIDTAERFEKVYVDALPEAVQNALASHFDDTNKKVTLSKKEFINYAFKNLCNYCIQFSQNTVFGSADFNNLTGSNNFKVAFIGFKAIQIVISQYSFVLDSTTYKWNYSSSLETNMVITVSDTYYASVKQAITKDLIVNLGYVVIPSEGTVDEKVSEVPNVEEAQSGTISSVLGLNSSGKLVKGTISGGTQLYKHSLSISVPGPDGAETESCELILATQTQLTTSNICNIVLNYFISGKYFYGTVFGAYEGDPDELHLNITTSDGLAGKTILAVISDTVSPVAEP